MSLEFQISINELVTPVFMQQNCTNRDKNFQKLCPDNNRFSTNVRGEGVVWDSHTFAVRVHTLL